MIDAYEEASDFVDTVYSPNDMSTVRDSLAKAVLIIRRLLLQKNHDERIQVPTAANDSLKRADINEAFPAQVDTRNQDCLLDVNHMARLVAAHEAAQRVCDVIEHNQPFSCPQAVSDSINELMGAVRDSRRPVLKTMEAGLIENAVEQSRRYADAAARLGFSYLAPPIAEYEAKKAKAQSVENAVRNEAEYFKNLFYARVMETVRRVS